MECNKLEKKIHYWAINLGFTLPDGSAPPVNHFSLLTSTPHRRQLWEVLVESVQSRQKIQHMRKQILVAKHMEKKKNFKSATKQMDRFDLWLMQNKFESEMKEQRSSVVKLERNIMSKASDTLFEFCKLSEMEKQLEEFSEKSMVLKLLSKRKRKITEDLQMNLSRVKQISCVKTNESGEENSDWAERNFLNAPDCSCLGGCSSDCNLLKEIEDVCESEMKEQVLWNGMIRSCGRTLERFLELLEDLDSNEKSILREKIFETEKSLAKWMTQLKQKATEKCLEIVANSTDGKLLETEVEKLVEKVSEDPIRKGRRDASFSESASFLVEEETRGFEGEKALKNLKNYLKTIELQDYQQFLVEELKRSEEEVTKLKAKSRPDDGKNDEGLELTLKTFESVIEEINRFLSEEKKIENDIFEGHARAETLLRWLKAEVDGKTEPKAVEGAASKLKFDSVKQIDLLSLTPLDVLKTVESPSGRLFECETASGCVKNFGGEAKQLLSALLIPPGGDFRDILSELDKRKKFLTEAKELTTERERMASVQKKIQTGLSGMKHDVILCEKNFLQSDGILRNVLCKADDLMREVDLIEKILKNWVEQPYRLMIKDTIGGKSLREIEEKYKEK